MYEIVNVPLEAPRSLNKDQSLGYTIIAAYGLGDIRKIRVTNIGSNPSLRFLCMSKCLKVK